LRYLIATSTIYPVRELSSQSVSIGIASTAGNRDDLSADLFLLSAEVALRRAIHLGPGQIAVAGDDQPF
jgi:hypothetical protein